MPCYLIAYDISSARLRDAVARKLEKRGRRIQKSVFMVECGAGAFSRLEWELHENLADGDSLLLVPLCERCLQDSQYYGSIPESLLIY